MRANYVHIEPLVSLVNAFGVPGDFAEFGVWRGTTFLPLAESARLARRRCWAVDSFVGMADPTPRDGERYPKGTFSVGGPEIFRALVAPFGTAVSVVEGFIPDVLASMSGCRFAFAHVDLDHYAPTLETLRFLWPRMSPGGVIAAHDWDPDSASLAAGAIRDWLAESGTVLSGARYASGHCWMAKPLVVKGVSQ